MTPSHHPIHNAIKTTRIGGFNTIVSRREELAQLMVSDCLMEPRTARLPKLVFSSNGQGISLAGTDETFMETMQKGDIIHADGMSVVFASRLWGRTSLPERIATTDFFDDAAVEAERHKLSFFMLGGKEDENRAVVEAIERRYPNVRISGRRNGYFTREEEEGICRDIVDSSTDVLWVGLGKPLQEHWCIRNRDRLNGVGWIKTCGGLYSFLSGASNRAPRWVQNMGLEWLHRAVNDPRRLAHRYLVTNPHAIYRLFAYTDR